MIHNYNRDLPQMQAALGAFVGMNPRVTLQLPLTLQRRVEERDDEMRPVSVQLEPGEQLLMEGWQPGTNNDYVKFKSPEGTRALMGMAHEVLPALVCSDGTPALVKLNELRDQYVSAAEEALARKKKEREDAAAKAAFRSAVTFPPAPPKPATPMWTPATRDDFEDAVSYAAQATQAAPAPKPVPPPVIKDDDLIPEDDMLDWLLDNQGEL